MHCKTLPFAVRESVIFGSKSWVGCGDNRNSISSRASRIHLMTLTRSGSFNSIRPILTNPSELTSSRQGCMQLKTAAGEHTPHGTPRHGTCSWAIFSYPTALSYVHLLTPTPLPRIYVWTGTFPASFPENSGIRVRRHPANLPRDASRGPALLP